MSTYIKRLRVTVSSWDETTITGTTNDDHRPCVIINSSPSPLNSNYIYPGAQLNLLLSEVLPDGRLQPQHIVLNPDYLIDVTAICRCFGHTGDAPALYLLHQFMPSETSAAILLGNVANQFLDDCVNQSTPDYRTSLVNAFCADPLRFATVEGIDGDFGQACRKQFANIQNTVSKLHSDGSFPIEDCELETAFICEALGIQGRMDLVSADRQHIIELKSGRGEEFGRPPGEPGFRYEHALQMALYKESLYYNADLPYARVHTSLLYSRYPSLQEIHLGRNDIHRAIDVRNGIVHLQHLLQRQSASLIDALTEAHFNVRGIYDRFYNNYLRPPILTFLETLKGISATEHAYFHTFLGFVAREQNLAKTGIEGQNMPPGYGGFADIWRTTAAQKRKAGNLIADLRIRPIADETGIVAIEATLTEPTEANFRCGDIVMLHEQAADGNDLEAQQKAAAMFTTCVIEKLEAESILLRLRYPQRNTKVFDQSRLYAIEPTHADANYSGLYRGLFALLTAPLRRRQLLLGQREPEFDETVQLNRPIDDAEGRDITLRAKQARDYFLLVGPPGTGKTSVALRRMVEEFMTPNSEHPSEQAESQPKDLLLLAYTNRAVDEICDMLERTDYAECYLRIGQELSCAEPFRSRLLNTQAHDYPTRSAIRQKLLRTPIIVGTLASISALRELFLIKQFDAAIIDEASQVLEPQMLPLWCAVGPEGNPAIGKFILIGDHKQLPAVVTQGADESAVGDAQLRAIGLQNCRDSLFERLHRLATMRGEPKTVALLHRQGRMHPSLSRFVSQHYYGGALTEVPVPHQQAPLEWLRYDRTSVLETHIATQRTGVFNVVPAPLTATASHSDNEKSNAAEAAMAARLVEAIASLCAQNGELPDWQHRLGIIVPFRSQIALIRNEMDKRAIPSYGDINIDTVERYQGSQRDIIIFSATVRSAWGLSILSAPVQQTDCLIDRKLNVALTRARKQFFLIGDATLLSQSQPYRELLASLPSLCY